MATGRFLIGGAFGAASTVTNSAVTHRPTPVMPLAMRMMPEPMTSSFPSAVPLSMRRCCVGQCLSVVGSSTSSVPSSPRSNAARHGKRRRRRAALVDLSMTPLAAAALILGREVARTRRFAVASSEGQLRSSKLNHSGADLMASAYAPPQTLHAPSRIRIPPAQGRAKPVNGFGDVVAALATVSRPWPAPGGRGSTVTWRRWRQIGVGGRDAGVRHPIGRRGHRAEVVASAVIAVVAAVICHVMALIQIATMPKHILFADGVVPDDVGLSLIHRLELLALV